MNLLDQMQQFAEEIADGRVLYRHLQVTKHANPKAVSQEDVNNTFDDVETLTRHFAILRLRAESEIAGVVLSEAIETVETERARDRLLATARRVGTGT